MMMTPSSGDSSTVFALLTAIASPEAAKASLQEITDASVAYQKAIDDFRKESAKTKSDLSNLKDQADAQFAAAKALSDDFNATSTKKSNDLSNLENSLSTREATVKAKEDVISNREIAVQGREDAVNTREKNSSSKEDHLTKLTSDVEALSALYNNKLTAMKSIIAS